MIHILFLVGALLCISVLADPLAPHYALEEAVFHFEEFIIKFNKQYADEQEKATRFEIFKLNLEKINQMNERSKLATYGNTTQRLRGAALCGVPYPIKQGITPHIDLTPEEFFKSKTGLKDTHSILCDTVLKDDDVHDTDAPDSFDWREQGAVTDVKNQGDCGSCYAFSSIASVESQYFIKHKNLVEVSEQEIVDCDDTNSGCDEGYMSNALRALKNLGGAVLETDYPYKAVQSKCKLDKSRVAVKVSSCISFDLESQEKLKQVLYKKGPVVVAIQSGALKMYHGGIIEDSDCWGGVDHAVLLVGYGIDPQKNNETYWILKNSWGKTYVEGGYFRLQRSNNNYGACAMLNNAMVSAVVE